jgi:hypothetical protein
MNSSKSKYDFLKIPDEEGGFVYVKRHIFEEEFCGTKIHFFEPGFIFDDCENKIVRKDIFWEDDLVRGYKTNGFLFSNKEEWEEYARKKFLEFKDTLLVEPESNDEICDLNFHWGC